MAPPGTRFAVAMRTDVEALDETVMRVESGNPPKIVMLTGPDEIVREPMVAVANN